MSSRCSTEEVPGIGTTTGERLGSNRLEQSRALATRHAERAACYRSTVLIAATVLWLRT